MQPVVMLLVSGVIMFSVIGGLSLLAHYYTLNGIKSKTVGDGQHGTARFATKKEIEETYVEVAYEPEKWRKGAKPDRQHRDLCWGALKGQELEKNTLNICEKIGWKFVELEKLR